MKALRPSNSAVLAMASPPSQVGAEPTDDGGVGEDVERLGDEGAEGRHGEDEDLAIERSLGPEVRAQVPGSHPYPTRVRARRPCAGAGS